MSALTGNLGGSMKIKNGVLRSDLTAIENIDKNMFVDILENFSSEINSTSYSPIDGSSGYPDCCKVSENKGLFIYGSSSVKTLYGVIFSINDDGTVTFGNETVINAGEYWYVRPRCFRLKDNKVLLVNNGTTNDGGNLCLITVDGLSFTVGSNKKNAVFFNNGCFDFEEVSHNNFVLTGEIETNRVVGGQVITYDESNDSLSFGKTYALDSISNSGDYGEKQSRIAKESENKFLYVTGTTVLYLYRMKVNTIDKTISREGSIKLSYDNVFDNYPKSFALFENDIYIANNGNGKVNLSYGVLGDEPIKLETIETNVPAVGNYADIIMKQIDDLRKVSIASGTKREIYSKTATDIYEEKYELANIISIAVFGKRILLLSREADNTIRFVVVGCYKDSIRKKSQNRVVQKGISAEKISEGSIGKVLV